VEIDWSALHGEAKPRRVPLPTYPFERKRHWIEPYPAANTGTPSANGSVAGQLEALMNGATMTNGAAMPLTEVEALIEGQLRIMAKQIEVLRHAPAQIGGLDHE